MLPAPARDTARDTIARVKRLADSPRTRRLDMLEHLWKGTRWDERPSFWDKSFPQNERGTCVQSSIAESSGGRLINLTFGNSRFPTLTVCDAANVVPFADEEKALGAAVIAAIVKAAHLRTTMRAALEQGLMCGTVVAVIGVCHGVPQVRLLPAKFCERTLDDDGDVARLEYRYRYEIEDERGELVSVWYRRVIDAVSDSTWEGVPCDPHGWLPDWDALPPKYAPRVIAHGLGFCPVLWHRNRPDVSDTDPVDGSALFDGLEDEIFALDMAMSQRHRNGRYNGEPQIVQIGFGENDQLGPQGRGAAVMPSLDSKGNEAKGSWFSRAYDSAGKFLGLGGAATRKAPGTIWKAPVGGDVKLVESSGAGATILGGDIDGLRATILEARSIVIASPESLSANASAALLRQVFEPMIGQADNFREEYGDVLCAIVDMLLHVCAVCCARGMSVRVPGFPEVLPLLSRCFVTTPGGAYEWTGLPLDLAWGEYFEPTWADITSAITAARAGNGDEPVLTLEQSVRLVAAVIGVTNVERYLAELTGSNGANRDAAHTLLGSVLGDQTAPPVNDATVADAAMNGAQGATLKELLVSAASGELPPDTIGAAIRVVFPSIDNTEVERMLAPIRANAGLAAQHAALQDEHAALKASHQGKSAMLANVLAKNAAGELVQGSPIQSKPADSTNTPAPPSAPQAP